MSIVIGCGTHLGKQQPNYAHLRCCGIKKACARIQNKWTQPMWDDFEKALSKHHIPVPSPKERKKGAKNETEGKELSTSDLYLIAKEIIKIETPLDPKYFSMNSKIYAAYLAKKGPNDPDVAAWGALKQKYSKKQKKKSKDAKQHEKDIENFSEPQTKLHTNVKIVAEAHLRTPVSPPSSSSSQKSGGLALIEGLFVRSSESSNPNYPRAVVQFLEDILPEVDYWECDEDELERAEIYISAMDEDEVEFKRGKFIVKELSLLEHLPDEGSENANTLFGMPIEIVTPDGSTRIPAPSVPPQGTPDQPSMTSPKSPPNTPGSQRTTRSKSAVIANHTKESPLSSSNAKRQKLDKSS